MRDRSDRTMVVMRVDVTGTCNIPWAFSVMKSDRGRSSVNSECSLSLRNLGA